MKLTIRTISVIALLALLISIAPSPGQGTALNPQDAQEFDQTAEEPALELLYVTQFQLKWWDKGSGGDMDGAYYQPVVPAGYYPLGSYGQGNYGPPTGPLFAARELVPGSLAAPQDYTLIYGDWGSGADLDGSFWRPVPQPGYVCLGDVAQAGYDKPPLDAIRCVRQELAAPANAGVRIWYDKGTGATMYFDSYRILPASDNAIYTGTFIGNNAWSPPEIPLFALGANAVAPIAPLPKEEIDRLIKTFGPTIYLHPEEAYYMDAPEWVLDNGARLAWALIENETDYDTFNQTNLDSMPTSSSTFLDDINYVLSVIKPSSPYNNSDLFKIWLDVPDSITPGDMFRAKTFVHVLPWNTYFTEIQFWFYYPFNGGGRVEVCLSGEICDYYQMNTVGRHYSDWEHVSLLFLNDTRQLVSIYMSAHSGGHQYFAPSFGTNIIFEGMGLPQYYTTIQSADIDGDGAAEMLARTACGIETWDFNGAQNTWNMVDSCAPAWSDTTSWTDPKYYSTILTGDIDGDSKAELLGRTPTGIETWRFVADHWEQVMINNPAWSDAAGWGVPQNYATIQTADINGDGKAELLGRNAGGIETWSFDGDQWVLLKDGEPAWSDASGWNAATFYATIRTGDIDDDGKAELLGRSAGGMETWRFETDHWVQEQSGNPAWSDATGWGNPQNYTTIQVADIDGDGKAELLGRSVDGMETWRYNASQWELVKIGDPAWSDAVGWNVAKFYATIQTGDINGDGMAELLARGPYGMESWRFVTDHWALVQSGAPAWSDAAGWSDPKYYISIQTTDINGDGKAELLGRSQNGMETWRFDGSQWVLLNDGQLAWGDQTRPIIYFGKFSHAHYASPGYHDYMRVESYDYGFGTFSVDLYDLTGIGMQFCTYCPGKYEIISSAFYPLREPDWLQFSGRWGKYEKLSYTFDYTVYTYVYKEVGAGPTGPGMKTAWKVSDMGEIIGWPSGPVILLQDIFLPLVAKIH